MPATLPERIDFTLRLGGLQRPLKVARYRKGREFTL
jgi:hypothetical protein